MRIIKHGHDFAFLDHGNRIDYRDVSAKQNEIRDFFDFKYLI